MSPVRYKHFVYPEEIKQNKGGNFIYYIKMKYNFGGKNSACAVVKTLLRIFIYLKKTIAILEAKHLENMFLGCNKLFNLHEKPKTDCAIVSKMIVQPFET